MRITSFYMVVEVEYQDKTYKRVNGEWEELNEFTWCVL